MSGVIKVFVESSDGTLVPRSQARVERVTLRQLRRDDDMTANTFTTVGTAAAVGGNEQLAKVQFSYGNFPKTILRKTEESGLLTFEFPFGPKEVQYSDHALKYQEIRRPGRKPLLRAQAPMNRSIKLNAVIADRETHGLASCEDQLQKLKDMAEADMDIEFRHGYVTFPARLRITSFNISSQERTLQGAISRASIDLAFKEVVPLNLEIVHLKAILEEPKPIATIPDEDEIEKRTPDGAMAARGADAFEDEESTGTWKMGQYLEDRPTLNTADANLLRSHL